MSWGRGRENSTLPASGSNGRNYEMASRCNSSSSKRRVNIVDRKECAQRAMPRTGRFRDGRGAPAPASRCRNDTREGCQDDCIAG